MSKTEGREYTRQWITDEGAALYRKERLSAPEVLAVLETLER